jgi:hypothetical protein
MSWMCAGGACHWLPLADGTVLAEQFLDLQHY